MIKVLVADAHPLFCAGIRSELSKCTDIELVGEANNFDQILHLIKDLQPNILLLGKNTPGLDVFELIRKVQNNNNNMNIVVVISGNDLEGFFEMIEAGAKGFVLREDQPIAIVNSIQQVTQGRMWFSTYIAEYIVRYTMNQMTPHLDPLTNREKRVLQLIAEGCSNSEIAEILVIAEGTVKNYVSRLYSKLNLHSRAEVVAWAWKNGITNEGKKPLIRAKGFTTVDENE